VGGGFFECAGLSALVGGRPPNDDRALRWAARLARDAGSGGRVSGLANRPGLDLVLVGGRFRNVGERAARVDPGRGWAPGSSLGTTHGT
jgi:hypothetical protein